MGGVADRRAPPEQGRDLHEHWGRPRIEWYQGGHLTFMRETGVRNLIDSTLRAGGLLPAVEAA